MVEKYARWFSLLGIVGIVLFMVSLAMAPMPPAPDASAAKVTEYYAENASGIESQIALSGVAALCYLLFVCAFAYFFRSRSEQQDMFGTLAVGGVVISISGWFAANSIYLALAAGDGSAVGDDVLVPLHSVAGHAMSVATLGDSMIYLGIGLAVLATRLLPVWLGWIGVVVSLLTIVGFASGNESIAMIGLPLGLLFILATNLLVFRGFSTPATAGSSASA